MGGINSCFPSSVDAVHTSRRRHFLTKAKHDQPRPDIPINTNNNNNNNTIDLNHASEDELLLLPGITRQIAKHILQYRQLNHGFKRIDELLYITGINHDLFECIRYDISIHLMLNKNLSILIQLPILNYTPYLV
jgi:hypothetical protein